MAKIMKIFVLASFILLQVFLQMATCRDEVQNNEGGRTIDNNTKLPSFVQQIYLTIDEVHLSVAKVLTCQDGNYKSHQFMNPYSDRVVPDEVRDPAYDTYSKKYGMKFKPFSSTAGSGKSAIQNLLVDQAVAYSSEEDKKESVDLTIDCPRWCRIPITLRQTLESTTCRTIQFIAVRFICDDGDEPKVTVIQTDRQKQQIETYVYYTTDDTNDATKNLYKQASRDNIDNVEHADWMRRLRVPGVVTDGFDRNTKYAEKVKDEGTSDDNTKLPFIEQRTFRRSGTVNLSVVKVLTCQDGDYQSKQIMTLFSGPSINSVQDQAYYGYINKYGGTFTKFDYVNGVADFKDKRAIVTQMITMSFGEVTESVNLVIDCARWCKIPITFRQTIEQTSDTSTQTIAARFICEKGDQPNVTVIQDTPQQQKVETYVYNKDVSNNSDKKLDKPASRDNVNDSESLDWLWKQSASDVKPEIPVTKSGFPVIRPHIPVIKPIVPKQNPFISDRNHEHVEKIKTDDNTMIPSIEQEVIERNEAVTLTVVRVLKCENGDYEINQRVNQFSESNVYKIRDGAYSGYMNKYGTKFRKFPSNKGIGGSAVKNVLVQQTITNSNGEEIKETVDLIIDCSSWCRIPITLRQTHEQTTSITTQHIAVRFICDKGDLPNVTVFQNNSQKQEIATYVYYKDVSSNSGKKDDKPASRNNVGDSDYEDWKKKQHEVSAIKRNVSGRDYNINNKNDDTTDNDAKVPCIEQDTVRRSGTVNVSVSKVLTCNDGGYQNKQYAYVFSEKDGYTVKDPEYNKYIEKYGKKFSKFASSTDLDESNSDSEPEHTMVKQEITLSCGDERKEFIDLILDCPLWCKSPITLRQTLEKTTGSTTQTISARFICEKGHQPTVTVIQNNPSKQKFDTYVYYTDDSNGLSKKVGKPANRNDVDGIKSEVSTVKSEAPTVKSNDPARKLGHVQEKRAIDDNIKMPSIVQEIHQSDEDVDYSVLKVLRCRDDNYQYTQITNPYGKSAIGNEYDANYNEYSKKYGAMFKVLPTINGSEKSIIKNLLVQQTIAYSFGKRKREAVKLIIDCPRWCKIPITLKQTLEETTCTVTQLISIRFICEKGDEPKVTVIQNNPEKQAIGTYVYYRDVPNNSGNKKVDRSPSSNNVNNHESDVSTTKSKFPAVKPKPQNAEENRVEDNTNMPSIVQKIYRSSERVLFSVVKVLKCRDGNYRRTQFMDQYSESIPGNVQDRAYNELSKKYSKMFIKFDAVKGSGKPAVKNVLVQQNIAHSVEEEKKESVYLIIDCPRWCKIPIVLRQNLEKTTSSTVQLIVVRFICDKGNQPRVTVFQNNTLKQKVYTYVYYTDVTSYRKQQHVPDVQPKISAKKSNISTRKPGETVTQRL